MAKPNCIELPTGERIPILYEDRSVLAIDKPRGWMLIPYSWQNTDRNLQAALTSSIAARDFWARSRNLKFIRYVHRLDAETTGILLLAKSPGALETFGELFESREMEKVYLAVVRGAPRQAEWTCRLKLAQDLGRRGRMKVDARLGKEAETRFRVLQSAAATSLIEAHPFTGRTHQIRVHLAECGVPVIGDDLYGVAPNPSPRPSPRASLRGEGERSPARPGGNLALRAASLAYTDPFTKRRIRIEAPVEAFGREYGFDIPRR